MSQLPAAINDWIATLPTREQWIDSENLESGGLVGHALAAAEEEAWSEKSPPATANRRLITTYLNGTPAVREAMDLVLIELTGLALSSLAERAMPADAFAALIEASQPADTATAPASPTQADPLASEPVKTTTTIKEGAPAWVVEITQALATHFFASEASEHVQPCIELLEGQGGTAIEWHSGGGFMHAIGAIERDGLRVLFWTGIDAVGANAPSGDWTSPEDGWQAMGLEGDEAPSLLVEISG